MSHEIIRTQKLRGDAPAANPNRPESGQAVVVPYFASCENACPMVVSEMKQIQDASPSRVPAWDRLILVSFDSKTTRLRCPVAAATGSAWEMSACYLTTSRLMCGNWLCFVA